jgi:hypothetical protein
MVGQASGPYSGSCITFLDAADMLAFDTDTSGATLDHYTVTSAGFTYYDYSQYSESTLNGFGCFKLSGGLAFGNAGGVANPATVPATQIGVFPSNRRWRVQHNGHIGSGYLASTRIFPCRHSGRQYNQLQHYS